MARATTIKVEGFQPFDESANRALVHRILRGSGVWKEFCHWSDMWLMMPEVAYRLSRCITPFVSDTRWRGPLLARCFVDAAVEIRRWPTSDATMALVADAVRAMLKRALEASLYVIHLPGDLPWLPDVQGPLADTLAHFKARDITIYRRDTELDKSLAAMHSLLEHHVYCARCSINLRQSYAQLMGVSGGQ